MKVLSLSKSEVDFTKDFLQKVNKIKPSVLDYHVFLKDQFIKCYRKMDLKGMQQLLDPNRRYDDEHLDIFYNNLEREFKFLKGGKVTELELQESEGCRCSRENGGEVYNFINPVTKRSLSYWFTVSSKEFDASKCYGPEEGNDALFVHILRD